MPRPDGRALDALRPVEMILGFHRPSEGSVLYRAGGTVVLCTASVDEKVPPFLEGKGKGWVTAEYQMHPRANPRRQDRDGRGKAPSGRTQEIQRLVGRALRAAVDLEQARRAHDHHRLRRPRGRRRHAHGVGHRRLRRARAGAREGRRCSALREPVAATSVGYLDGDGPRARPLLPRGLEGAGRPERGRHGDAARSSRCRGRPRASRRAARRSTRWSTSRSPGSTQLAQHAARRCSRARASTSPRLAPDRRTAER